MLNKQIKNIFYTHQRSLIGMGCNVLYKQAGTFFDSVINELSSDIIVPLQFEKQVDQHLIDSVFYSGLWINDIIEFSQTIPDYANFYTKYIMCIHNSPSPIFKREDLSILKNKLNSNTFLCFDQNNGSWPMDNVKYSKYGIPKTPDIDSNKEKDILVINGKKQKQTYILYQYLKNDFPQADMLESCSINFEHASKIISKYKICIDLDNYFNLVLANACGSYGITSTVSFDDTIFTTKDYNEVVSLIPNLLSKINIDNSKNIRNNTLEKYDWNSFENNIKTHLNTIMTKDFSI